MKRAVPIPLPTADIETRFFVRLAEALAAAKEPKKFAEFPAWTQRVMLILKGQLIPQEFEVIITEQMTVFHEGVMAAFLATIRDLARHPEKSERRSVRKAMDHLATTTKEKKIARQMASGALLKAPMIQRHVYKRIFASNPAERRAFIEGLALGCRILELGFQKADKGRTDATEVYFMLWLFWPEIDRMNSVGDVGRSLGLIFAKDPNLARNWDQRFRKIANRLRLSFRDKQSRP